eukprot:gnl/Dysnectes_brevis/3968_a5173_664.p1 GENE.gnl/Dysnectes_brevis/3968_a5173_664~~gnl/Dysnectes_brevis/3968_a5173_664.p1  ORF type:complete len:603 (+),score=109.62 gnl/Dysnectes_brevis/3968_a5173_664:152-1960(+)
MTDDTRAFERHHINVNSSIPPIHDLLIYIGSSSQCIHDCFTKLHKITYAELMKVFQSPSYPHTFKQSSRDYNHLHQSLQVPSHDQQFKVVDTSIVFSTSDPLSTPPCLLLIDPSISSSKITPDTQIMGAVTPSASIPCTVLTALDGAGCFLASGGRDAGDSCSCRILQHGRRVHLAVTEDHMLITEAFKPGDEPSSDLDSVCEDELQLDMPEHSSDDGASTPLCSDDRGHEVPLTPDLLQQQRVRGRVLREVIDTENTYNRQLTRLLEAYLKPLASPSITKVLKTTNASLVARMQSSVTIFQQISSQLLAGLEESGRKFPEEETVHIPFLELGQMFKCYKGYASAYMDFLTLTQGRSAPSAVRKMLAAADSKGEPLPSLLITPIQRLPRIVLLFREYLKHRPPHPAPLLTALSLLEEVTASVNEGRRAAEAMDALLGLAQELYPPMPELVSPGRRVLGHWCDIPSVFYDYKPTLTRLPCGLLGVPPSQDPPSKKSHLYDDYLAYGEMEPIRLVIVASGSGQVEDREMLLVRPRTSSLLTRNRGSLTVSQHIPFMPVGSEFVQHLKDGVPTGFVVRQIDFGKTMLTLVLTDAQDDELQLLVFQ